MSSPVPRAAHTSVIAAVVVLSVLWGVYAWRWAQAPSPRGAFAPARAGNRPPLGELVRRRPVELTAEIYQLHVVDEVGAPVASAQAVIWPENARVMPEAAVRPVAAANRDGMIVVPAAPADRRGLVVWAEGFVTTWATAAEPIDDHVARLTLRRGRELLVLCHDERGQPLAGVEVLASRASGPRTVQEGEAGRRIPGPDVTWAVYRGTSDRDGRAVLYGLLAGEYAVRAELKGWVPVAGLDGELVSVPAATQDVVFARVLAAVVEGPAELFSYGTHPRRKRKCDQYVSSLALGREQQALTQRFPGRLVFVEIEAPELPNPPVTCALVVQGRGLHRADVPLRPLAAIEAPVVLGAETLVEPMAFGEVTCAVVDPAGQPYLPVDLWISDGGLSRCERPLARQIQAGQVISAPAGTYVLTSLDPVERHLLQPTGEFVVRAGDSVRHLAQLPLPLRRCRVRAQLVGGQTFDRCRLRIDCPTLPALVQAFSLCGSAEGALVALPCARVEASAWALGFGEIQQQIDVVGGAEELPLTLTFGGGS